MNIRQELRQRFAQAIAPIAGVDALPAADVARYADMVHESQDPRFGDYQANCAMPLGKALGRPPREVAQELVGRVELGDMCHAAEIAGPGFINLRIDERWLAGQLTAALADPRLGIAPQSAPRSYVIDYSAPNVAKPMHVGHIRSTVIGDSLYRTLSFLGHRVIGDNHIGDWGTQFGMIIFGYKHLLDEAAYRERPVEELARLYRLVNRLVEYHEQVARLPAARAEAQRKRAELGEHASAAPDDPVRRKKHDKAQRRMEAALLALEADVVELEQKIAAFESDAPLAALARRHPNIAQEVLAETARLHSSDTVNMRLWKEFMPACLVALEQVYERLGVAFDYTLGESFYHDRLRGVVKDLVARGIATESDGAICVFIEGNDAPLIIQKKDGAYLYATTDLATIQYRMQTWSPDVILYVVDHRQSEHFRLLFAAARRWGYQDVELEHVSFGTVLGDDGRPFKTRAGDTVGLTSLLDEAVERALRIVSDNDDAKPDGPELSPDERRRIAETVGIGALKYADLSQNRTSDYVFSYDKMLAMNGNTATYMQYAYARVRSIVRKGGVDLEAVRAGGGRIGLGAPGERALAMALMRLAEALEAVVADYRPNLLTNYLFQLAGAYSTFYDQCPVLRAESDEVRTSRLLLCDLTARTLKQGLALLGIGVVEQM